MVKLVHNKYNFLQLCIVHLIVGWQYAAYMHYFILKYMIFEPLVLVVRVKNVLSIHTRTYYFK